MNEEQSTNAITPFERIRRTNPAGNEYWSSRDFARVIGYVNYRHFQAVIEKARTACFNSGQRVEDHFVGIDEMIEIGKGGQRAVQTVMMSRYACYLVIQNADPAKEIVAVGQTYFAIQTRRQELSDEETEERRDFLTDLHQTLNAPSHPIRNLLLRLTADSPDLLAVIKQEGRV